MLPSAASRRDPDVAAETDASERLRSVRERLEAAESGLGELEFLRQRQEVLVRAALERSREAELSSEEKLLEENILLLRKQLVGPDPSAPRPPDPSQPSLDPGTQVCAARSKVRGEGEFSHPLPHHRRKVSKIKVKYLFNFTNRKNVFNKIYD